MKVSYLSAQTKLFNLQAIINIIKYQLLHKEYFMLIDNQILIDQIIKDAFDLIFWKDLEFKFLGCNLTFAKMAGFYNTEEITGKTDYDTCWKEFADKYRADDINVLSGETFESIEKNITATDQIRTIYVKKQPLIKNNEIIGLVGYGKVLAEYESETIEEKSYIAPELSINTLVINNKLISSHYFNLSTPELEALFFLIRGFSSGKTAEMLSKSPRTIEQNIESIKQKMSVDNKQLMINKAIFYGFTSIIPKSIYDRYHQ